MSLIISTYTNLPCFSSIKHNKCLVNLKFWFISYDTDTSMPCLIQGPAVATGITMYKISRSLARQSHITGIGRMFKHCVENSRPRQASFHTNTDGSDINDTTWGPTTYMYKIIKPCTLHIDGLVQERRNSSALAMELRFSCTETSISCSGDCFKSTHELRALNFHLCIKKHLSMYGHDICVEFQRIPLKFHTKYLAHTLKDTISVQHWNWFRFKNSCEFMKCPLVNQLLHVGVT